MISSLVLSLDPNLTNANSLSSFVDKMPESDQVKVTGWITSVLDQISPYDLSDRDKITYLKLYLRFNQSSQEARLEDLLSPELIATLSYDPT